MIKKDPLALGKLTLKRLLRWYLMEKTFSSVDTRPAELGRNGFGMRGWERERAGGVDWSHYRLDIAPLQPRPHAHYNLDLECLSWLALMAGSAGPPLTYTMHHGCHLTIRALLGSLHLPTLYSLWWSNLCNDSIAKYQTYTCYTDIDRSSILCNLVTYSLNAWLLLFIKADCFIL